jgi:ABC-2 type transport system permease protein
MRPFVDEAAARTALEAGEIQAYYFLPQGYASSGRLTVVYVEPIKSPARRQFYGFLAANLLAGADPRVAERLTLGSDVTVVSADGSRRLGPDDWFYFLVPMIAGIAFIIAMFTAGGYLMQAVVEEKENRTMEVLVTSVSPGEFMTGKIVGDLAIGLTQILAWIIFVTLLVQLGRADLEFLQGVRFSPRSILLFCVVMVPAFVMLAGLMAAIGATVAEAREGQQVVGLLSLPLWIPYMLTAALMGNPNSPLAVGMSLFPLTAPLTMVMRDGMTILPAWQIAASGAILILSAAGAVWLAGRAFRLGMLRYGKRLSWRELFARQGGRP